MPKCIGVCVFVVRISVRNKKLQYYIYRERGWEQEPLYKRNLLDGWEVGCVDGWIVGMIEGRAVGIVVGKEKGCCVGIQVGIKTGCAVGSDDG